MPRPAKIWKRKEDGFYYSTVNGRQTKLAQDYAEAKEVFHKLKAEEKKKRGSATRVTITLEQLCNKFLDHAERTKQPKTYDNQKAYLQAFCDFIGKATRVRDVRGEQLDEWCQHQKTWGRSTQAAARRTVMACFNFGVKRGLLLDSPLWGMERGRFEKRERIFKPGEREKVRAVVKGGTKDFLTFLELTGCRPFSEAARLTAAMIDWDGECVPLDKHKNERKGKRRVIYLAPPTVELLKRLAEQYPEGPLFRTQMGRAFTRGTMAHTMRRIERRAGLEERITPYTWRHSFITDCLAKGMSPTVVGELVGNSARTIHRYYAHLDQKKDALREAARRAVG